MSFWNRSPPLFHIWPANVGVLITFFHLRIVDFLLADAAGATDDSVADTYRPVEFLTRTDLDLPRHR